MSDLQVITQKELCGIMTVLLTGTIDAYTYDKLEQSLNNLIEQEVYKLIIDLSKVDYMFSHGIGLFIGMLGIAQKNSGNIVLLNPKPAVREILELLGFNHLFIITKDKDSAVNALGG